MTTFYLSPENNRDLLTEANTIDTNTKIDVNNLILRKIVDTALSEGATVIRIPMTMAKSLCLALATTAAEADIKVNKWVNNRVERVAPITNLTDTVTPFEKPTTITAPATEIAQTSFGETTSNNPFAALAALKG